MSQLQNMQQMILWWAV